VGQSPHEELSSADYAALGEFRYRIRRFLHFSEEAARQEELEPQQHQMLLAIRAVAEPEGPTIGALAEHLLIRHHSAVGLIDRLEERGLVARARGAGDRRQVRVHLTPEGEEKLNRLSTIHRAELLSTGPLLVKTLHSLLEGLPPHTPAQQKAEDVSTL
jgi:DNA-binding MarR family transcriptional regulator